MLYVHLFPTIPNWYISYESFGLSLSKAPNKKSICDIIIPALVNLSKTNGIDMENEKSDQA